MLQQTQVATVLPYFARWMARFPTVEALAMAQEEDVLSLWQGLGYYRRAKLLLEGARSLNTIPTDYQGWRKVPGVGPYTAGAIASIAYQESVPIVDGNVERVYSRLQLDEKSGSVRHKAAWRWAEANVPAERPGDWNQALMELGATICRPTQPDCHVCPVSTFCKARQAGLEHEIPVKNVRPQIVQMQSHIWIPIHGDFYGIRQINSGEWWAGMWEFPRAECPGTLQDLLPHPAPTFVGSFRHTVTHHRIDFHVSTLQLPEETGGLRWVSREELGRLPMPAPQRKALRLIQA